MGSLDGRIAVITGAGRGLGRAHALLFASEGACVVVNDSGTGHDGSPDGQDCDSAHGEDGVGQDSTPAESVAAEIRALGGDAAANGDDVADWAAAKNLIDSTVERFGRLDIVVNNAGILRDRLVVNMTESEWDDVIRVHLRGHFCPTRHAAAYWREEHKAGRGRPRHIVNTSSTSGLMSNPGQSNYGAAKSGIATFTQIAAKELARYDVKVNCIAPAARTRLTLATPGLSDIMAARETGFDEWDPANVSPLVAYLSSSHCRFTGETFYAQGAVVQRVRSWEMAESVRNDKTWAVDELAAALQEL